MLTALIAPFTGWKKSRGLPFPKHGVFTQGDSTVAPTTWWNILWMLGYGWENAIILEVSEEAAAAGYYLGYLLNDGSGKRRTVLCKSTQVHALLSYENVEYYAVNTHGEPVDLTIADRIKREDSRYLHLPRI